MAVIILPVLVQMAQSRLYRHKDCSHRVSSTQTMQNLETQLQHSVCIQTSN
jgi:hypothetical protein